MCFQTIFTVPVVQTCTVSSSVSSSPLISAHAIRPMTLTMTHLYWLKKKATIVTLCSTSPMFHKSAWSYGDLGPPGRSSIHLKRCNNTHGSLLVVSQHRQLFFPSRDRMRNVVEIPEIRLVGDLPHQPSCHLFPWFASWFSPRATGSA